MTTAHAREVVTTCDCNQALIQSTSELLLLTNDVRPVANDDLTVFGHSFSSNRDVIIAQCERLIVSVSQINKQLYSVGTRWQDVGLTLNNLCNTVISIIECCSHAAYLFGSSQSEYIPSQPGIVDKYKITRAKVKLEIECMRIKSASPEDLTPAVLLEICSDITNHLTILTDSCKYASEMADECDTQDQFKLCIKSLTSCASMLIASIKAFKAKPNSTQHIRCVIFCEPMVATANTLVKFATEEEFTGQPAGVSQYVRDIQEDILGTCMNVASSCIQLCKSVRQLIFDSSNLSYRSKIAMCCEAIPQTCHQLGEVLMHCPTVKSKMDSR